MVLCLGTPLHKQIRGFGLCIAQRHSLGWTLEQIQQFMRAEKTRDTGCEKVLYLGVTVLALPDNAGHGWVQE